MYYFFFSSRRRHTILTCDWSSDVCSSDLPARSTRRSRSASTAPAGHRDALEDAVLADRERRVLRAGRVVLAGVRGQKRSEERRVGKGSMTRELGRALA